MNEHKYAWKDPFWGALHTFKVDAPLQGHPFASCGVKKDADGVHLYSYATHVATISPSGWLHVNGLYSTTTRKHIGYFLKEYGNHTSYAAARACYESNMEYNVWTGEWKTLYSLPEEP